MPTDTPATRLLVALDPSPNVRALAATIVAKFARELADPDLVDLVAAEVEGHPNAITTTELAKRAGISYRQADHWTTAGYLRPVVHADGKGSRRLFDDREVVRARIMGSLVNLIGLAPESAGGVATQILAVGSADVNGFHITRSAAS